MSKSSKTEPRSKDPDRDAESDDTQYDSAWKPLMFVLLPLIALLVYGYFS